MKSLKAFLNSPTFFGALVALPSTAMIAGVLNGRGRLWVCSASHALFA